MAITITEVSGSAQNNYDRFGASFPLQLEYEANFGASVAGKHVNFNLYLWGEKLTVEAPFFPLFGPGVPDTGYNMPYQTGGYVVLQPAGPNPNKRTWSNVTVEARFPTTSTMRIRLRFLHTMDMQSWMQNFITLPNERRLLHARRTNPNELEYDPTTFYNMWNADSHLGVAVYLLTPGDPAFTMTDWGIKGFWRAWGWWWNSFNPDLATYPFSAVKLYYWEFKRNNIPVSTLSLTEDTDVTFTLESHGEPFNSNYYVGLLRVAPGPDNQDEYWNELPYALGAVTGVNTYGAAVTWFPHQINAEDLVGNCTLLVNTGGDIWQAEFTVKKESLLPASRYRVVVIVRHEFEGEPV